MSDALSYRSPSRHFVQPTHSTLLQTPSPSQVESTVHKTKRARKWHNKAAGRWIPLQTDGSLSKSVSAAAVARSLGDKAAGPSTRSKRDLTSTYEEHLEYASQCEFKRPSGYQSLVAFPIPYPRVVQSTMGRVLRLSSACLPCSSLRWHSNWEIKHTAYGSETQSGKRRTYSRCSDSSEQNAL